VTTLGKKTPAPEDPAEKPAKKPAKKAAAKKAAKTEEPAIEPDEEAGMSVSKKAKLETGQDSEDETKADEGIKEKKPKKVTGEGDQAAAEPSDEIDLEGKDAGEIKPKKAKRSSEDGGEDEEMGEDEEEEEEEEEESEAEPVEEKPREFVKVPLPEERWMLSMKIDADVQEQIELVDLQKLFGAYMTIKKKFFDDLITTVPGVKHYAIGKAIEKVTGVDKEDWTKNSWILVMAKEAKNKVVFWMLFKRLQDLSGMLVGIGPAAFAESIMGIFPEDPDSRSEYIKKLMIWLTIEPARWKNVGVFIPYWL